MNKSFLMLGLSASLLVTPLWSGTMGEVVPVANFVGLCAIGALAVSFHRHKRPQL